MKKQLSIINYQLSINLPMSEPETTNIESTLHETRVFPPPAEFSERAHIKSFEEYEQIYAEAEKDTEAFWAGAAEDLHWFHKHFL